MTSATFRHVVDTEVGLRLPDGTEIWPPDTWHGRGVDIPADRRVIIEAIHSSADKLGMSRDELLGQYRWVVREKHLYVTIAYENVIAHDMGDDLAVADDVDSGESSGDVETVASEEEKVTE